MLCPLRRHWNLSFFLSVYTSMRWTDLFYSTTCTGLLQDPSNRAKRPCTETLSPRALPLTWLTLMFARVAESWPIVSKFSESIVLHGSMILWLGWFCLLNERTQHPSPSKRTGANKGRRWGSKRRWGGKWEEGTEQGEKWQRRGKMKGRRRKELCLSSGSTRIISTIWVLLSNILNPSSWFEER